MGRKFFEVLQLLERVTSLEGKQVGLGQGRHIRPVTPKYQSMIWLKHTISGISKGFTRTKEKDIGIYMIN